MPVVVSSTSIPSRRPTSARSPHKKSIISRILLGAVVLFQAAQCGSALAAAPANYVTASYNPDQQVITLVGDAGNNSVTVAWKGNAVTVTGIGQTLIGNVSSNSPSVSFHVGSSVGIQATLKGGNDSIIFNTIRSSNVALDLGDGDDFARMTFCSVTTLSVNGGNGNDTFCKTATRISTPPTYPFVEVFLPPQ